MAGDDHPFGVAESRAGDDGIAIPDDLEMIETGKGRDDRVRDESLVARHRLDVAQLPRQLDRGGGQIELGNGLRCDLVSIGDWHPTSLSTLEA